MHIGDVLEPRPEVVEMEFQSVLQAHKVTADDRLESDPGRLLSTTYPSDSLEVAFEQAAAALTSRDNQGGITLDGPYGAGKSHALLALYHALDSPDHGQSWLDRWDVDVSLPRDTDVAVLSTSQTDADRLWEPLLTDLGREDLVEAARRYPTTDHLESLTDDGPTAIFLDEIETWWGSFDDAESHLQDANEMFLQNLLEVAADPDHELAVVLTLLDEKQDVKRVLDRTKPYRVDLNDTGDRERIVFHRLFETRREQLDDSRVRDIVQRYVDGYVDPVEVPEPQRLEDRMVETYPFHPRLVELLDDLFQAAHERQSTRGTIGVLADTVGRLYEETDLLVTSDVSPRPFRGMRKRLFDRFVSDRDVVAEIDYGEELLQTILLYTMEERRGKATVSEALMGVFKPTRTSISRLDMSLRELYGTAHYLDREGPGGPYKITEDAKLTALVGREKDRILDDEPEAVTAKLAEMVRDRVFDDGTTHVLGHDEVPDDDAFTVAVGLERHDKETLRDELAPLYENRSYKNAVQVVVPTDDVRSDEAVREKAARLLGAQRLRDRVDDEKGELPRIVRDERRELRRELESRYGQWVKWTADTEGDLDFRRIEVDASVEALRTEIGRDTTYIGSEIRERVADADHGIPAPSLRTDFSQFRRLPVVLDRETFTDAVESLYDRGDVVLERDRSNYAVAERGDSFPGLNDSVTIRDPDSLPDVVLADDSGGAGGDTETNDGSGQTVIGQPDSKTTGGGTTSAGGSDTIGAGGSSTTGTEDGAAGTGGTAAGADGRETTDTGAGAGSGEGKTAGTGTATDDDGSAATETVSLEGNGSRVLGSQAASRLNESTDTISSVTVRYSGDEGLSKTELQELLDTLADASRIDVELEVIRDG